MKILLFGKNGQLGWELNQTLAPLGELTSLSSKELDVKNLIELKHVINSIKPNLIVNASAYTAVDRAEQEPEIAMQVNAHAPAVMAECAKDINAVFIHYSTDYVFDGEKKIPYIETDLTNPLSVYGKSKLEGELAVKYIRGINIIFRTSWMYSFRGENFLTKVLSWANQKEDFRISVDQIGSPTWSRMVAEITSLIIAKGLPKVNDYFSLLSDTYHLCGIGGASRYEYANAILKYYSKGVYKDKKILPAYTSDFLNLARRPLFSALDCSHFENTFDLQLPAWNESLKLALNEYL